MRYLSIEQVIELHRLIIRQSGGSGGLRDQGALESAVAQPSMTFEGWLYIRLLRRKRERLPTH
jgi:death-on-curing protein